MKEEDWTVKLFLRPSEPCDLQERATHLHGALNGAEDEWALVHVVKDPTGKRMIGVYATVLAYNALRAIQKVIRPACEALDAGLSAVVEASASTINGGTI